MLSNMEIRQSSFLILGFCCFILVIYLLSVQKSPWKEKPLSHLKHKESKFQLDAKIENEKPNFVFILTDDQDSVLGSMQAMKNVQKLIMDEGVTFKNSFVASPLCCPSRSSILSGQYVHNHKAFNNSLSGGCSNRMWQKGPERKSFVNFLHRSGYHTFFAGKYLNQYGKKEAGGLAHIPPGWDWWIGLEGNSKYYNYNISVNGSRVEHFSDPETDYFTNIIRRKALEFLDINTLHNKPFFMMLSTPACHAPFDAEPKYDQNFTQKVAPRTVNFNIANDESKHWLLRLGEQPLRPKLVKDIDEIYRKRLRTLLTVDDMVKDVVEKLDAKGLLQSTYIIFTSDNGYHLGQFSLPLDKREPYEFDVRVPFSIRGPGIPKSISEHPISNIDIAPTVLDLAGIPIPRHFDGESLMPLLQHEISSGLLFFKRLNFHYSSLDATKSETLTPTLRKSLLVEHWGEGHPISYGCEHLGSELYGCDPKFSCKCSDSKNNTYSCLRHLSQNDDFLFCLWEDNQNFEEMYDLRNDIGQLNNTARFLSPVKHKKFVSTLNNLKKCRGSHCAKLSKFVF